MENGLLGYWNFEESGGQIAKDSSNYANNGTLGFSASADALDPKWATGIKPLSGGATGGGALKFDGKDDYVNAGNDVNLDVFRTSGSKLLTIDAWIQNDNNTNNYRIVSKGKAGEGYSLWVAGVGSNRIWFTTGGVKDYTFTATITDTSWHYIAVVYDSSYDAGLYLDGVFQEKIEHSAAGITSNEPLYIGAYSPVNSFFNGLIDDVRIYNRTLSAAEIRYHYNRGGPVTEWTFDEGSGSTAYDETSNNNDGTLYGGMATSTADGSGWKSGKYGTTLQFDGTDDYVNCGDINAIDGATKITIENWAKWGGDINGSIWHWYNQIKGAVYGLENGYSGDSLHKISFTFYDGATWYSAGSITNIDDGKWHHIVGVYDGAYVRIYIDGVQENSNNVGAKTFNSTANSVFLGSNGGTSAFWKGIIDDVRVYNYARTQEQIMQDYNAGLSTHFK